MRTALSAITVLGLLGVGAYGLSAAGAMPQEVYSRALGFAAVIQGGEGPFDGTWVANARSSVAETDEAYCGTAEGRFVVQGTRMYGSVRNEFGNTFMVSAHLDNGGELTGGMALGVENVATFSGVLLDSDGSGSWSDELGCYGDVSFRRITALGSHDSRYVQEVSGRVFVVRGVRTIAALPGTTLRDGDVVSVEDGSYVTLSLVGDTMKISEKTKFEVPDTAQTEADGRAPLFGRGWTALKYLIQGPSFEIKIPSVVAGARG